MLYAQFYQMSTGYIPGTIPPQFGDPKLIEARARRSDYRIELPEEVCAPIDFDYC